MNRIQDQNKLRGKTRYIDERVEALWRVGGSHDTSRDEQKVLSVVIKEAYRYGDGCVCIVRVLSNERYSGQEITDVFCPQGLYAAGDKTVMMITDGENPRLAPKGGAESSSDTENDFLFYNIWTS